ncbi:2'-5' RNA ligase family protein [Jonesia quinghaiensis]|uniref:2'-5' RNA ligase family protein n=1 Tax=Jonesia quinghaiensis TaxID=262806 RepID=UPI000410E0AC|nr:2'-5' RNA ligase family protein [Jonesia quinghaiensis]
MQASLLGAEQRRIGVSIAVPPPYAEELVAARRATGDPLADAIPAHITILGPTVIDADNLDRVYEHVHAACRAVEPFDVHLRGSATFRPISPVVFIQVVQGIAECEELERRVRSGLLDQHLRFNYHPHVTIAHEVDDDALDAAFEKMAFYEATFPVTEIHVFEHGDDDVWRPVRAFALGVEENANE